MRRLWLADVHANLPAFEAVLQAAGAVDEVVFLGDIVGYGPHPAACVDRLQRLQAKAVLGNHDASALASARSSAIGSHPLDWDAWTHNQLSAAQLSYLTSLPAELRVVSCQVTIQVRHHIPGAPYFHPAMPDGVLAGYLEAVSGAVVFCGHSHRRIERSVGSRRLVCVPPVGQPRNGDPRASYVLESDGVLEFGLVPYDIESVVSDVQRIGLPDEFCRRWVSFLRTGYDREWSRDYPA